jgi:xanthine dehydrogenase accessory factor
MKEISEIIRAVKGSEAGSAFALATVVDVQGSSYRLPGAKMLVRPDGSFVGTVSGGCVEADVLERAARVLETGAPEVFLYDTTGDDDTSVFSLNMGCKGIVRVLLEKVDAGSGYINFLEEMTRSESGGYAVTTIVSGACGASVAERAYYDSGGERTAGDHDAADERVRRIAGGNPAQRPAEIFEADGAEYFIEFAGPPPHLLILGAGADAIPLADLAKRIGWRVTVADHRAAYASKERFASADSIIVCRPEELGARLRIGRGTAIVTMSHNFNHDREYLKLALSSGATYVGALGPKVRTEELLDAIEGEGVELGGKSGRLFAPVGLDTGGADPESIAISIISEISAVFAGRGGGHLRARSGPIYDR